MKKLILALALMPMMALSATDTAPKGETVLRVVTKVTIENGKASSETVQINLMKDGGHTLKDVQEAEKKAPATMFDFMGGIKGAFDNPQAWGAMGGGLGTILGGAGHGIF